MIHRNVSASAVIQHAAVLLVGTLAMSAELSASDDLTKPIKPSSDGHFLVQPDGSPFFWLGDTAWDLFQRLRRDEVEVYLGDRARKGYTIIQAVVGGVHTGPNIHGEQVFVDNDPTRPNPRYFENVDWVVQRAAQHGLRIAMLPHWGYDLTISGVFTPHSAKHYGRWLGQRYRHSGVAWVLGGDSNPLWPKAIRGQLDAKGSFVLDRAGSDFTIVDHRPVYDAMAEGIVAGEGGRPLITYHPSCCSFPGTPKPRTSLYFNDRSWLTMHMFQSSHYATPAHEGAGPPIGFDFGFVGPFNYQIAAEEYQAVPARPVVDGEPRFEDLGIDNDALRVDIKGYWTGYDARNAAYHSVFAGAAGHTYGNHSVWQFYDPSRNKPDQPARADLPWQKAIDRPVAGQLQYLKTLMLSRPYFSRMSDQSLIVGATGEGTAHVGATRDRNGDYAMLYLPHGLPVKVDLDKLPRARLTAWWYDPRTGAAIHSSAVPTGGVQEFIPPSSGVENDWVLVIDVASKGFGAPGAGTRWRETRR